MTPFLEDNVSVMCLFICLNLSRITQNCPGGFQQLLVGGQGKAWDSMIKLNEEMVLQEY